MDYFSEAGVRGSGFFTFTWLYVGVPLALTILTAAALQYKRLRKHLPIGYFAGLVVFLVRAVVFEGVNGLVETSPLVYSTVMVGIEEGVEFAGITILFVSVWGIDRNTLQRKK